MVRGWRARPSRGIVCRVTTPLADPAPHHGSTPRYAVCEHSFATAPHHRHIRELGDDVLHLDGGLDAYALCGEHVDKDLTELSPADRRRLESATDRLICPVCAVGAA
jgi:hypothetical protein